jgi:hypothetical protein
MRNGSPYLAYFSTIFAVAGLLEGCAKLGTMAQQATGGSPLGSALVASATTGAKHLLYDQAATILRDNGVPKPEQFIEAISLMSENRVDAATSLLASYISTEFAEPSRRQTLLVVVEQLELWSTPLLGQGNEVSQAASAARRILAEAPAVVASSNFPSPAAVQPPVSSQPVSAPEPSASPRTSVGLDERVSGTDSFTSQGQALFDSGQYSAALNAFVLAIITAPGPQRLFDLAKTYEALGNTDLAAFLYRRFLDETELTIARETARLRLEQLGHRRVAPRATARTASAFEEVKPVVPTTLSLTVTQPGAEVFLDGVLVGRSPVRVQTITPGAHRIEVKLPGYEAFAQELQAPAGQQTAMVVTLSPGVSAPITAPPASALAEASPPPEPRTLTSPSLASAAPSASSGLAGSWFATPYSEKLAREKRSLTMTLAGVGTEITGELLLTDSKLLPAHKRGKCAGATEVTTTTRFRVRYGGSAESGTLFAEAPTISACSCEGQCSTEDGFALPVRLSTRSSVMAGEDYFFQRYDGVAVPTSVARALDGGAMAGAWTVFVSGVAGTGTATLNGSAGKLSGTMTLARSVAIQSWRKNECGGKDTAEATFRYKVSGEGDMAIDLEFWGDKWETCSCGEGACASAAALVGIDDGTAYWTVDGNHIVSSKVLMVRD